MIFYRRLVLSFLVLFLAYSCGPTPTPLPRGYFRIDLPEKSYVVFDSVFPYTFEYPIYARVAADTRSTAEPFWADVLFPDFRGAVHLSYKKVNRPEDLQAYFEDARNFANKHIPKAMAFAERTYANDQHQVYGLLYEIQGSEVASSLQFYLTDSLRHFLRGALYFNTTPNNDSLAPVLDFIKADVEHLIETLEWKKLNPQSK